MRRPCGSDPAQAAVLGAANGIEQSPESNKVANPMQNTLQLETGFASLQGPREDNQDFGAFLLPRPADLALRGAVAAVADGVGGAAGGRIAAETCVRQFLDAYYSLPETLGVEGLAARALAAANRWVHAQGRCDPQLSGMASTFSALILRGRRAHVVHVGDSRIYRLRGDALERLTEDHTLTGANVSHILYRAVGLEEAPRAYTLALALETHDRFLLCSDGLYTAVREPRLKEILTARESPQGCAERLANLALEQGGSDNVTVLVVDVLALPPAERDSLSAIIAQLPLRDPPEAGQTVDGFRLERLLSEGRYSKLFLGREEGGDSPPPVVLKFPQPRVASEREYHDAFLREAWIGARVKSPWLAEVLELPPGRQTRLYSVLPYYPGETLEKRLGRNWRPNLTEGVDIAVKLCRAAHALHRQRVVHRDIKTDNILLGEGGGLRLLDLGVARLKAWDEDAGAPIPGTPSYMAPELFRGDGGSEASDIFALGVTLFRLFSGGVYPYGEIEPFSTPRFGAPKRLSDVRPELPAWLDAALARAIALAPAERHADALELASELENGLLKGGPGRLPKRSLYQRNPLRFWQCISFLLLTLLLGCLATSAQNKGGERLACTETAPSHP